MPRRLVCSGLGLVFPAVVHPTERHLVRGSGPETYGFGRVRIGEVFGGVVELHLHVDASSRGELFGLWVFVEEWDGSLNGLVDDVIDFRTEENPHLFELDRVYNITLSSGMKAVRIDYRAQESPAYCVDDVSEIVVLVGSRSYELLAAVCDHSLVEYQTVLEAMVDSFTP